MAAVSVCIGSGAKAVTWTPHDPRGLDPLGLGCYDYSPSEWNASFGQGKGLRSAPLCIKDPCEGALNRDELSHDIVGRPVTDAEWDIYYSRYAEYCRSETRGSTTTTDLPVRDLTTITPPTAIPPVAVFSPPETVRQTTSKPFVPEEDSGLTTIPINDTTTGITTSDVPPTPIPVVPAGWSILAAVGGLGALRMVQSRRLVV